MLTRAQLAKIGPRELQLIRGVLRRLPQVDDLRRAELVAQAAETMRVRLDLPDLPNSDGVAFLKDLLSAAERSISVR